MAGKLSDIAKKVGVSEATVSRVLNGSRASPRRPAAVLTALDVLGYERPTKLRGGRRAWWAVLPRELQNPIFPAFAEVVGGALAQHGFTPVLCTQTTGGMSEADYVDMLLEQQVSGMIFAGGQYARPTRRTTTTRGSPSAGCPSSSSTRPIEQLGFPRVSCDDAVADGAGDAATSSRSATSGSAWCSGRPTTCRRGASSSRVERRGRAPDRRSTDLVAHALFSLEGGQAAATRLLAARRHRRSCAPATRWPSARSARARRAGLRVPEDVSVVGYDDSAFMSCTEPPLTTVRQPIEAMGRAAVDLLVGQIDGRTSPATSCSSSPSSSSAARPRRLPAPCSPLGNRRGCTATYLAQESCKNSKLANIRSILAVVLSAVSNGRRRS